MNAQLFTDAMSELNDKYVMEAVSYQRKSKPQFNTWLSNCFAKRSKPIQKMSIKERRAVP